jgi:hypothetical protein
MTDSQPPSTPAAAIPELLNSEAVHKHLDILQSIIERLAGNASTCKNWCITLVSGAVALSFTDELKAQPIVVFRIAYGLTAVFWLLDSYYHALERAFRDQSNQLIRSIHNGTFVAKKLLVIVSQGGFWTTLGLTARAAFTSFSTIGFYLILGAAIFAAEQLLR